MRSWKLLKELDPHIELSEAHRSDMLLELSGLDKQERLMVQASIGNAREFDKVEDALVLQHPKIHLKEKKSNAAGIGKGKGGGKHQYGGKGGFKKPFKKAFHKTANVAEDDHEEEWDEQDEDYL